MTYDPHWSPIETSWRAKAAREKAGRPPWWFVCFACVGIVALALIDWRIAVTLVALIVLGLIYFTPAIVALRRWHRQRMAITMLNLFLGWSLIGWVGALVWACTTDVE
jgi:hypothetical protein